MATLDKGSTLTLLEKRLDELARLYHEIKDEKIRKEIEALSRRLTMARPAGQRYNGHPTHGSAIPVVGETGWYP